MMGADLLFQRMVPRYPGTSVDAPLSWTLYPKSPSPRYALGLMGATKVTQNADRLDLMTHIATP